MHFFAFRKSTLKLLGCIICVFVISVIAASFVPYEKAMQVSSENNEIYYGNAQSNEGRITFLKQFGWLVNAQPISTVTVTVPNEFDNVFLGYNELQKLQGLDLSRYKQKKVTRYTYLVRNYPSYTGKVYANVIVYRGTVIGGDICTEASDGFIHGFTDQIHL